MDFPGQSKKVLGNALQQRIFGSNWRINRKRKDKTLNKTIKRQKSKLLKMPSMMIQTQVKVWIISIVVCLYLMKLKMPSLRIMKQC